MKSIRIGLVVFLALSLLLCTSCQGRVTSTPQAVETQTQTAQPASEPPQETAEPSMLPDQVPDASEPAISEASVPASAGSDPIGYADAVEAVLANHTGGVPLKCSLDYDDGLLLYEIDVLGADGIVYEVQVDAVNAVVIRTERDDDPSRYTASQIVVPYTQAVTTAMDSLGECTFESFEIDTAPSGTIVYEIELLDAQKWEQDIEVDAATGAIVSGTSAAAQSTSAAGGGAAAHHAETQHSQTLAENMIVNADVPVSVCGSCGQYPCVCSSAPVSGNSLCATCHSDPCVCWDDYSAGSSTGSSSSGTTSYSGTHHSEHHSSSSHHSSHHG